MRVGIIGYRNHAARIRGLAVDIPGVHEVLVYHPTAARLAEVSLEAQQAVVRATSDFEDLASCVAVLVCSPSDTHKSYLEKLVEAGVYIFCEKPIGVTPAELAWLSKLTQAHKARIYCNHNYAQTDFCLQAEALIREGRMGLPMHLEISATHGLSYKESFATNWRFSDRDAFASVIGNVGIHYFHMALRLFGEMSHVSCRRVRCNPSVEDSDACAVMMQAEQGQTVSIYLSYSAPYTNAARLMMSDGMLELNDGCLKQYGARESYDVSGRFATPPCEVVKEHPSSKSYYDASLRRSLDLFFEVAESGRAFSTRHFDQAVNSAAMTLEMYGNSKVVDVSICK